MKVNAAVRLGGKTGGSTTENLSLQSGLTLVEVMLSLLILVIVFGGVLTGYITGSYRAEWSGYSLAAQALGIQQLEQARSGVWDSALGKNELTNMNLLNWTYNAASKTGTGYSWAILDVPVSGTNTITATNYVTVRMLYLNNLTNPPVQVQMVTVQTVWPFNMRGRFSYFTNTTATYYGPDNRDDSSL